MDKGTGTTSSASVQRDSTTELPKCSLLMNQGDFEQAEQIIRGYLPHPVAIYLLGELYERAPCYADRRYMGLIHYLASAEVVPDMAAPQIARCYSRGIGSVKSWRHAAHWNLISGHCGSAKCYYNAALNYWKAEESQWNKAHAYALMMVASVYQDELALDAAAHFWAHLDDETKALGDELTEDYLGGRELWRALAEESGSKGFIHSPEGEEAYKLAQLWIHEMRYRR
jgi:TPR repeat protein